jgi:hypothetical protein
MWSLLSVALHLFAGLVSGPDADSWPIPTGGREQRSNRRSLCPRFGRLYFETHNAQLLRSLVSVDSVLPLHSVFWAPLIPTLHERATHISL